MRNEEEVTPTGRIIIIGAHTIPRSVLAELTRMGVEAMQVVSLEASEEYVKRRIVDLDFAKLEERVFAVSDGRDRAVSYRTVYGGWPEQPVAIKKASKNDPWYRREAKGGKRNRRW